jgi:hypothetical protein
LLKREFRRRLDFGVAAPVGMPMSAVGETV